MVLPLKSLKGKYLVSTAEKDLMLYEYIEHKVFNEVDINIDRIFETLEDLFTGLINGTRFLSRYFHA